MASIFTSTKQGSGSCGTSVWTDFGLIPTGLKIWIGYDTFGAVEKLLTFEIRGNAAGQSAGTTGATTVLATASVKAGATVSQDLYKNGTLIIRTVVGAGIEKWWLRVYSKTSTAGSFNYTINYTNY